MANIRTLVVDDEELARERLIRLLETHQDVQILGEAEASEEAIQKILEEKPDLAFIDVQMPECSGMEVVLSLPEERPAIIFCTAYDQYAIETFELNSVIYLVKPINPARLARALDQVRRADAATRLAMGHSIDSIAVPTRFLAQKGNRYRVVPQQSVLYFQSRRGATRLFTRETSYGMEPPLSQLATRLEKAGFYQISKKTLVNLESVEEAIREEGGGGKVRLLNGRSLKVSRQRMADLARRLDG